MLYWHFHPGGKPHCAEQMLQTGSFTLILHKYAYLPCPRIESQRRYFKASIWPHPPPPKESECRQNGKERYRLHLICWYYNKHTLIFILLFLTYLLYLQGESELLGDEELVFSALLCHEPVGLAHIVCSINIRCTQRLKFKPLNIKTM